ncbi:MAG TPA: SgcJ/EcaC family oxidoreductase [Acidimicrobiales bacterium]|nr:SgcJ/EcaC family oxidoreductase [Acidimicrobiales bacterium]
MADSPEDVIVEFEKAAVTNDFSALADLYEEDALLVMATMEVRARGRDEIKATWEGMSAMGQFLALDIESREIVRDGNLAVAHLVATVRLESPDSTEATLIPVRATEVMRRGDDGKWRYLIDHS